MRRFVILLALALVLLAACQPALPAGSEGAGEAAPTGQEEPVDNPARQPVDEGPEGPAAPSDEPVPELIWDEDPENVVISATFCCGFVPRLAVTNYIPDATIFGDGRIIWTVIDDSGGRQVFEAQLTLDALEALLAEIAAAGFFGWEARYADLSITDLADQCIQVNLTGVTKSVCEYHQGAPEAFHALYDRLAGGAGLQGEPFIPEAGYLTVENVGGDLNLGDQQVSAMDEAALGFNLEMAEKGVWVEGPALARLWQEVNVRPWLPLVQEGGSYFQLGLQIPGLSLEAPSQE